MTLTELRNKYPRFIYDSFKSEITPEGLTITHFYKVDPDIKLQAQVTLLGVTDQQWQALPEELRDAWAFHLGLAEIPSYWKLTASPEIVIKAGHLNADQLAWWNDLLIKGMGEYFYVNQIDFTPNDFVTWTTSGKEIDLSQVNYPALNDKYLVPVGGGKDSAFSLCFLDEKYPAYDAFLLNPTPAMQQIAQIAKPQQIITAKRQIDPRLLELNKNGYLNGHIPFSAYIAWLSRLAGLILGHQSVVISNERSSNEGNVWFHGKEINHQYSKSYEFERNFADYVTKHQLMPSQEKAAYFSLLRPLYELQISHLFIDCKSFSQYASVFRSCNRGQKTNTWCGECPKCLFTFTSLYPFMDEKELISIFGQNLFKKESLLNEALPLLGKTETKPFECVGTHEESTAAFYLCIKKIREKGQSLPSLLQLIWDQVLSHQDNLENRAQTILKSWNKNHQLPAKLAEPIKNAITQT